MSDDTETKAFILGMTTAESLHPRRKAFIETVSEKEREEFEAVFNSLGFRMSTYHYAFAIWQHQQSCIQQRDETIARLEASLRKVCGILSGAELPSCDCGECLPPSEDAVRLATECAQTNRELVELVEANAETIREQDDQIERLEQRNRELVEANVRLEKELTWVVNQIDDNYRLNNEWVDDPCHLIKVIYESLTAYDKKAIAAAGGKV